MGLGSGFFRVVLFFGGVFVVVFPEVFAVGFFVAVFLPVGFFAGVDEGFVALGVVFGLGLPGAVLFWRVEVVFEVFSFAFGVVVFVPDAFVEVFFVGIILQCHESQVVRGQEPDTIQDYFQHLLG